MSPLSCDSVARMLGDCFLASELAVGASRREAVGLRGDPFSLGLFIPIEPKEPTTPAALPFIPKDDTRLPLLLALVPIEGLRTELLLPNCELLLARPPVPKYAAGLAWATGVPNAGMGARAREAGAPGGGCMLVRLEVDATDPSDGIRLDVAGLPEAVEGRKAGIEGFRAMTAGFAAGRVEDVLEDDPFPQTL